MELEYFDGLNKMIKRRKAETTNESVERANKWVLERAGDLISTSMTEGRFGYLALLSKYFDKNNLMIEHGLSFENDHDRVKNPLLKLINEDNLHSIEKETVEMYFQLCIQCKYRIDEQVIESALKVCDSLIEQRITYWKGKQQFESEDTFKEIKCVIQENYDALKAACS